VLPCNRSVQTATRPAAPHLLRHPVNTKHGKALCITYYENVSCISYQAWISHAQYCHQWPVWLFHILPHFLIKGTISGEKVTEHKIRALIFSRTSGAFIIPASIRRDIVTNVLSFHVKYPLFLSNFKVTWIFLTDFLRILQIPNLIKIRL
jgi:hypothetical protein